MRFSLRSKVSIMFSLLVILSGSLALLISTRLAVQAADQSIVLTSTEGPPTTVTQVRGTGFKSSEQVSIAFDTAQVATITTSSNGAFLVSLPIPKSAQPGNHIIQAIGQTSGRSAQAIFLVQTDWTQFRFRSDHTGYNPYENVLTPSNVSTLALGWSYSTGSGIGSPAVVNGVVYVGSDKLYALDAVTGKLKWSYSTGSEFGSPAVVNGVVYVSSGKLYALDAATGKLKWSYSTVYPIGTSPTVVNGVVYVGSNDAHLYALDAATGSLKWSYSTVYVISTSPAVANGVVYFGVSSFADKLYALDAATGSLKWSYTAGDLVESSPSVVNGMVYFGSDDDKLYALDAVTGALKWSYTAGSWIESSPAVVNGVVYVGSDGAKLYAFHLPGRTP